MHRGEALRGRRPAVQDEDVGDVRVEADVVVMLHPDGQYEPSLIPQLVAPILRGDADLVLGSRYVSGGRVGNWGVVRRAISRGASLYTALFLQMGVHDPTGGFKCFRRRVLETLDLDAITAKGYAFQIETTYRAKRAGFRIVEVPITFVDRTAGHSKMSRTIVLEAVWRVPLLRLGR